MNQIHVLPASFRQEVAGWVAGAAGGWLLGTGGCWEGSCILAVTGFPVVVLCHPEWSQPPRTPSLPWLPELGLNAVRA